MTEQCLAEIGIVQLAAGWCLPSMWQEMVPDHLRFGLYEPLSPEEELQLMDRAQYLLFVEPGQQLKFRGLEVVAKPLISIEENPTPEIFDCAKMLHVVNPKKILFDLDGYPLNIVGSIQSGKGVVFHDPIFPRKSCILFPPRWTVRKRMIKM